MRKYKYFLFDMDGTLIDSIPFIVEAFQRTFEKVLGKREEDEEAVRGCIGLPLVKSFTRYPPEYCDVLVSTYIKQYDLLQEERSIPMFDGIYDMLTGLRGHGAELAIVTSKRIDPTVELMEMHGFNAVVSALVCREDCKEGKPSPEPVEVAMRKLGTTDKSQVLFIGDSIHDLRCAKNAGVDCAMCDWTRMDKDELREAQPEHWLTDPSQLLELVIAD